MESMPAPATPVTVGVDTHLESHVAAVVDRTGRLCGTQGFPASTRGYVALVTWAESFGPVARVGVEGTGTFGAGLARFARAYGLQVLEVDRPDRSTRRRRGTSDPVDAHTAARATWPGWPPTIPKTREGQVEMLRVLRVARRGALNARVAAASNSTACSTAPPRSSANPCSAARPKPWSVSVRPYGPGPHQPNGRDQHQPATLARRWQQLQAELDHLDIQLQELVASVAPTLVALPGVGGRDRRPAAGDRRRQPPAAPLRGCLRPPVRRRAHPRLLGPDRPPPAQPGR